MTKQEFIDYLKQTLIPDLVASDKAETAADFEAAVFFLEGAKNVEFRNSVYGERTMVEMID